MLLHAGSGLAAGGNRPDRRRRRARHGSADRSCGVFLHHRLCAVDQAEAGIGPTHDGINVEVERMEHILAGARRCAYRVTPVA